MTASNENDVLLKVITRRLSGAYNQLQTFVDISETKDHYLSEFISIHERQHVQLNDQTAFGGLVMAYANLNYIVKGANKVYFHALKALLRKCRIPHEVYATYSSAEKLKGLIGNDAVIELIQNNAEYLDYYNQGRGLVGEIKYSNMRELIFFNCMTWCLQDRLTAEVGLKYLDNFRLTHFQESDFPNQRWSYLKMNFSGPSIEKAFLKFVSDHKDNTNLVSYRDILLRDESLSRVEVKELYEAILLTSKFLHEYLDSTGTRKFERRSFSADEHLTYFNDLVKVMQHLFPPDKHYHPMRLNSNPYDFERSQIIQAESEVTVLSSPLLLCMSVAPQFLQEQMKSFLLNRPKMPFVVMARDARSLHEQYRYEETNVPLFAGLRRETVAFTRCRYDTDSGTGVLFVPFKSAEEIETLLSEISEKRPIVYCTALSTYTSLINHWDDYFTRQTNHYYLNDLSIIFFLERLAQNASNINYDLFAFTVKDLNCYAMIFKLLNSNGTHAIYVAPCSVRYLYAIEKYTNQRYPRIKKDTQFTHQENLHIATILLSVMFEESSWFYKSGLIINSLA